MHIIIGFVSLLLSLWTVCRYKGVDRLVQALVDEWYYDIKANQIGAVVGGIGPLSAFTQLSKLE